MNECIHKSLRTTCLRGVWLACTFLWASFCKHWRQCHRLFPAVGCILFIFKTMSLLHISLQFIHTNYLMFIPQIWASLVTQIEKNSPEMRETWGQLTLTLTLTRVPWRRAWQPTPVFWPRESPWTEGPGRLQSRGSQSQAWLSDWAHTMSLKDTDTGRFASRVRCLPVSARCPQSSPSIRYS